MLGRPVSFFLANATRRLRHQGATAERSAGIGHLSGVERDVGRHGRETSSNRAKRRAEFLRRVTGLVQVRLSHGLRRE